MQANNEFLIPTGGVEDMITLPRLSEGALLYNLRERYDNGFIYVLITSPLISISTTDVSLNPLVVVACRTDIQTYTGTILVSVNPYQRLPIYGPDILKTYLGK